MNVRTGRILTIAFPFSPNPNLYSSGVYNYTRMERVNSQFPTALVDELDQLIEQNRFESRSAAIRYAVRQMLQKNNNDE